MILTMKVLAAFLFMMDDLYLYFFIYPHFFASLINLRNRQASYVLWFRYIFHQYIRWIFSVVKKIFSGMYVYLGWIDRPKQTVFPENQDTNLDKPIVNNYCHQGMHSSLWLTLTIIMVKFNHHSIPWKCLIIFGDRTRIPAEKAATVPALSDLTAILRYTD